MNGKRGNNAIGMVSRSHYVSLSMASSLIFLAGLYVRTLRELLNAWLFNEFCTIQM
jgi:hypothetical protein